MSEEVTPELHQAALSFITGQKPEAPPPEQQSEAPQEQSQADPQEQAPQTAEEKRRHKLTVKGEAGDEEVEVDDDELIRGYMRQRDYTVKTQSVAKERESLTEQVKKQIEPALSQYQQNLKFFEQALWKTLAPEIESTDWNALAKDNPAEWARKRQGIDNVNNLLQAVKAEQEKLSVKQQEEARAGLQKQVNEAIDTLRRDLPGWNTELYGKILEAGEKYGYSRQELNSVADARAIKILHDAMQYQALKSSKTVVEKKVAEAPKVIKPGVTEKPDQNQEGFGKAMDRLRKSGRVDDAHAAAIHFLKTH